MTRLMPAKVNFKPKIVVTNAMGLTLAQKARLEKLGKVKFYDDMPSSADEWLERCRGHNVVCSWMAGLRERYGELKNVFISVPFVGVSSFADRKVCRKNNITISNSPGCNRHAVAEWVVYMMLTAMRRLDRFLKASDKLAFPLTPSPIGMAGKNVVILGKGNIGGQVGKVCEALEMNVNFFIRGDDLINKTRGADVVVDALSANPTSNRLLGRTFFDSLKVGAIFISPTVGSIVDIEAMLSALDRGRLAYVGYDVMDAKPGDTSDPLYERLRQHPKVFVTPYIAGFSDVTTKIGNDTMIDNVEAWVTGRPINVYGL